MCSKWQYFFTTHCFISSYFKRFETYIFLIILLILNSVCKHLITFFLIAGSLIHRLRGVDPDGDELIFGIRNQPGSDIIRVENFNPNEANIYLNKPLDREVLNISIILFFFKLPK